MAELLQEPLKFIIPLDPKTKKNSMQPRLNKKKQFLGMMQSDAYQQYESDCLRAIPVKARIHINEPINVTATYYMKTRRKVDKTNLESALLDVLVKAGVIEDDNCSIVAGTDGSRVRYDKNYPRTEVIIEPLPEEPLQFEMTMEEDW
jgi:Holliday junction resolvase RusA-like endonuclease